MSKPAAAANQDPHYVRGVPKTVLQASLVRLALVVILAASVALLLWSYFTRLKPVTQAFQQKTSLASGLVDEVQQLQINWDTLDADRTDQRFTEARKQLFASPEEWQTWQNELKQQTLSLAFEGASLLGKPQPHPRTNQNLTITAATVDLQPAPAARMTNSPYNRLLAVVRGLESKYKRVDLVELTATGTSNSVEQARVVVHLWSQERSSK